MEPINPTNWDKARVAQGFILKLGDRSIPLDHTGFKNITFRGEYPVGIVTYRDDTVPVEVKMEAFSPFIPLDTKDSSLPATVFQFTLKNTSDKLVKGNLMGFLENAVCNYSRGAYAGEQTIRVRNEGSYSFLECTASRTTVDNAAPPIVFEDWSKPNFEGWKVEGDAFVKPIAISGIPAVFGVTGQVGEYLVHSYFPGQSDEPKGKLTSDEFVINRNFIQFWIGGGNVVGKTGINLLVDDKVVLSEAGNAGSGQMVSKKFDVQNYVGRKARLQILDDESGSWGHVSVGQITFTNEPELDMLDGKWDEGTMGLALLGGVADEGSEEASKPLAERLVGELGRSFSLEPGATKQVRFVFTWFFPKLVAWIPAIKSSGQYYSSLFDSAAAVARYVADNQEDLIGKTMLWRDTWYDSTLPYWFLDRTFANTAVLASGTVVRYKDGRFYSNEGLGCCGGTCGHVWNYAQAVGRLFPDLERNVREVVDFDVAMRGDGAISFRGEAHMYAVDGQAGYIIRALREHQMSPDNAFLTRIWPKVKKAIQWLIDEDQNSDGILEGKQHNTLDFDWYGQVPWLSGVYVAALEASAEMADVMGEGALAAQYRAIAKKGSDRMTKELFDGEYFYNKMDIKYANDSHVYNTGTGCLIDQVLGQSWAFQVGLPRVFPQKETLSALKSIWRYNFSPDVGHYRKLMPNNGRWYAAPGEAAVLMCTFPRTNWYHGGDEKIQPGIKERSVNFRYFTESMSGFEHQLASHMIWEGMVEEGLAIERAVHDRYDGSKRNPWNEIECGDYYIRAMASYGVFLAACGYRYDGPRGILGFAPKLTPENFKAAFTTAEGWGSFSQIRNQAGMKATYNLKYGTLALSQLELEKPERPSSVWVTVVDAEVESTWTYKGRKVTISPSKKIQLNANDTLTVSLD